ncbi:hypothetical protein ATCV1_z487R [Acanthocystis turfacea chlorella virus 1]|uniref:Uncharacterized protein z487R n=1 Tax=Chlorovirus heliozoae TaxID=322019 RepID=A7K997_9PHYC|nr:hypothetical protein ATCV1_z487R [Acanthocystis turfacea chlorella virus 1]ABT16621.1 hypothetical protein ATCV1_z487R [Acanthocystis turfacea chlorella virus 1]
MGLCTKQMEWTTVSCAPLRTGWFQTRRPKHGSTALDNILLHLGTAGTTFKLYNTGGARRRKQHIRATTRRRTTAAGRAPANRSRFFSTQCSRSRSFAR